jgi:tripeptide aminopeptidase
MLDKQELLNRFLRYVQVDTTASTSSDSYPSSEGQLKLGRMLAEDLIEIGLEDVEHDEYGLVWGTIPSTVDRQVPVIAFNAHIDTSPETTGANIKAQVIDVYEGGDIVLPADQSKVISTGDNPELNQLIGKTLVTTDGTTLLGGDDKAGIAIAIESAAYLMQHPEIEHGPIKLLFTCDEEIGHGVKHVDIDKLQATACYTFDGAGANLIDVETFSADQASVTVKGINIHPSIARNRMVNAMKVAAEFIARLPGEGFSPETTDGRQGFIHPVSMNGGVEEVVITLILRDFETPNLQKQADTLNRIAGEVASEFPGASILVDIIKQYRNMAEGLANEPRAVDNAVKAHENLGRNAKLTIIRGGTDGSQFTERGLPTPNLSCGGHNPHSPLEWVCVDEMDLAAEVMVELARIWAS